MNEVVIAYVPVLHEGYRRFLEAHARGKPCFVIGPSLYVDYRPLAKDIRCLDADLVAKAIEAWDICTEVGVLDEQSAAQLARERPSITLPAEDVSYQLVERFFARCAVRYDTVFLRWDKSKSVQLLVPRVLEHVSEVQAIADVAALAEEEAAQSIDWWRQVGAAMRVSTGEVMAANNVHNPHPLSAYAAGDPRNNFFKGVSLEVSTATHAEARLIGEAARQGIPTQDAILYVTDFPCPPCAKLIASAGVGKLYYRRGYSVLDGMDVLENAGVTVVQTDPPSPA